MSSFVGLTFLFLVWGLMRVLQSLGVLSSLLALQNRGTFPS